MKNDSPPRHPVKGRDPADPSLVPAVARAVAILDRLAEADQGLSLSQLARELGMPKSSAHGLCQTLCALRLLRPHGGGFALGPHVLHWSQAFLAKNDVVSEFHAIIAQDPRLSDCTVSLSALLGDDVVYLACRNTSASLGISFRIGMRLPAIYTSTGKAMLAHLDAQALDAALPRTWPAAWTRHSVANRKRLLAELAEVRKRGFAIDNGQIRDGLVSLGAAIIDAEGKPVAGMALSMTAAEATPAVVARRGAIVADIGRELSQRI